MERDDVRVGEPSADAYLELKELAEPGVFGEVRPYDLEGDGHVEHHVVRAKHSSHSSFSE
jgi:hypothetical protein